MPDDENVRAYGDFYDTTLQLMKSTDLKAFDLNAEPAALRDRYGRSKFGQGCLLARRLVESGVRFVEVGSGGWDMHKELADSHGGPRWRIRQGLCGVDRRPRIARDAGLQRSSQ